MSTEWAREEAAVMAAVERIAEGWCGGTQSAFLYRLSRRLRGAGEIVEIGTYAGKSVTALAMGQRDAAGRPVHTFDRREHPDVAENLRAAGVDAWVHRHVVSSLDAAATWSRPIELLFIDGGHSVREVRDDISAWSPFVVEGGLVTLHDYPGWEAASPGAPEYQVHRAVHETLMTQPIDWQIVSDREHGSIFVLRRLNGAPRLL